MTRAGRCLETALEVVRLLGLFDHPDERVGVSSAHTRTMFDGTLCVRHERND